MNAWIAGVALCAIACGVVAKAGPKRQENALKWVSGLCLVWCVLTGVPQILPTLQIQPEISNIDTRGGIEWGIQGLAWGVEEVAAAGGVFDAEGQLVGIAVTLHRDTPAARAQGQALADMAAAIWAPGREVDITWTIESSASSRN